MAAVAVAVRLTCPEEGVAAAAAAEVHHHPYSSEGEEAGEEVRCDSRSLKEVDVGEGVRAV